MTTTLTAEEVTLLRKVLMEYAAGTHVFLGADHAAWLAQQARACLIFLPVQRGEG